MYLYGAGGHAKVIIEILQSCHKGIKGIFDDNIYKLPVFGFKVNKGVKISNQDFPTLDLPLIISIGDNERRAEIAQLLDINYGLAIHPTAIISRSSTVDAGTVILHGSILQNDVIISKHVLINTSARICRGAFINNYAHVSPHAVISENAVIGEGTHIGAGAVVTPGITIGKWCKIGAGTVVHENVPDYSTFVGNPGKHINRFVFSV